MEFYRIFMILYFNITKKRCKIKSNGDKIKFLNHNNEIFFESDRYRIIQQITYLPKIKGKIYLYKLLKALFEEFGIKFYTATPFSYKEYIINSEIIFNKIYYKFF